MSPSRWSVCRVLVSITLVLVLLIGLYAALRFLPDRPVAYADPVEHFKYGSLGGERNMGFPYWLFAVLPEVCPDLLPGQGYASLGFIFEPGHDLPVGMSKRRQLGIDRVFLNCAVCHTSTVRTSPDAEPMLVPGNRVKEPPATSMLPARLPFVVPIVSVPAPSLTSFIVPANEPTPPKL